MKSKKILILLIITNIILLGFICSFININGDIIREKQIVKEMSESTQVTDLNNQINSLNTEHTEYMNYIQTCKTAIATALTNEGVETSDQETLETMAGNISRVLQARTKDATATAEDIVKGKTAYVNGEKIIGIANLDSEIVGYATKIYYQHKPTSVSIRNVLPGTYTLIITSGYTCSTTFEFGNNPATISGCTNKTLKYTSDGSLLCIYEIVMESEGTITITTTGNSGYNNASYISAVIVK